MKISQLISMAVATATGVSALSSPMLTQQNNPLSGSEIDTKSAFEQSAFPIKPDALIARAKEVLAKECGIGQRDGGECLADDFEFCAAVIGPLKKEAYLNALSGFSLEDNFAINPNYFGFTVSPVQPYRVYCFTQQVAKQIQPVFGVEPTNKELVMPPQCLHLDFNEDGKVKELGFYTVDRRYGNSGGLGGAFGYFYGIGAPLPYPEAKPFKPSWQLSFFIKFGDLIQKFQKKD